MNRRTLALLPWMVVSSAALAQVRPAELLYSYRDFTPLRAFRLGDECFYPIDAAESLSWKVERDGDNAKIDAEGKTISVPARNIGGRWCVPMRKSVEELGGGSEWLPQTDTLQVWSPVTSLQYKDGKLSVATAMAVKPFTFTLGGPDRAVVDLAGARLPNGFMPDLPAGARAFQYRTNVVRVVLEVPFVPKAPAVPAEASAAFELEVAAADLPTAKPTEPVKDPEIPLDAVVPPLDAVPAGPFDLKVASETNDKVKLVIPIKGSSPATFRKLDPSTLEITLPVAGLQLPAGYVPTTTAITSATTVAKGKSTVLTLFLARPMGAEVTSSNGGVSVTLVKPSVGDGKLAGKVVIVDPGHGGSDSGATMAGVMEKSLTLRIGSAVTERLIKAGATVLMTRKTDVFIPLTTRSDISNRNGADLFISIHINSTGKKGTQSGTISFHHKNNAVGKLLAECVQAEMAKVNKLPNKGVWSDARIYPSGGFAVLRNTRQPAAVLLELGFINHPTDRARMTTEDFKNQMADAIVRGVRRFLGEGA